MNISEYYEYKKDNDKQIADYKAQQEQEKKSARKAKTEGTKEQIKKGIDKATTVATVIPHFLKATGAAAILGALGNAADWVKDKVGN